MDTDSPSAVCRSYSGAKRYRRDRKIAKSRREKRARFTAELASRVRHADWNICYWTAVL